MPAEAADAAAATVGEESDQAAEARSLVARIVETLGVDAEVVRYLDTPPDRATLERILDAASTAVLAAAGHRVALRRTGPAGLTRREVEVLQLLARGLSNKQIAERLVISPKTVANHVEHIYAKIGAATRTAAGLFAMQHGLLPEEGFPAGALARHA